ncbi:hypothetical protein M885DRAFT_624365, partial [Pelagophyceae sp. CCMP2097]
NAPPQRRSGAGSCAACRRRGTSTPCATSRALTDPPRSLGPFLSSARSPCGSKTSTPFTAPNKKPT